MNASLVVSGVIHGNSTAPYTDIAISPDGQNIYSALGSLGEVSIVRTDSLKVVKTVEVDDKIKKMAVSPDGSQLYLTTFDDIKGSIDFRVLSTTDLTAIADLPLDGVPEGLAVDRLGQFIYVTTYTRPSLTTGKLWVIDANLLTSRVLTLKSAPNDLAVSADGRRLVVNSVQAGAVFVIAPETGEVLSALPAGRLPSDIALTRDDKAMIVPMYAGTFVETLELQTGRFGANVTTGAKVIAIAPTGRNQRFFAVSELGQFSLNDAADKRVIATIGLDHPLAVASAPDDSTAYVAGPASTIWVITIASR